MWIMKIAAQIIKESYMSSTQYEERKSNIFTFLSPWLFSAHNSDACENNQSFV